MATISFFYTYKLIFSISFYLVELSTRAESEPTTLHAFTSKVLGNFWAPDGKGADDIPLCWHVNVDKVAVGVVFNFKPARVSPVVKNLAAQDMPTNPPNAPPALPSEPVMPEKLRVEVGNFVRRVMNKRLLNVRLGPLHKEAVVIRVGLTKVKMHKSQDVKVRKVPMV